MKLTNALRDAFVIAAMEDVPAEDYYSQAEKVVVDDIVDQLPPKVRAVWNDKNLRHWVDTTTYYMPGRMGSVAVPGSYRDPCALRPAAKAKVEKLAALNSTQDATRRDLKARLRAVAYACSTRKALAEALPEFEKYLPPEVAPNRQLPAVSGVVTEFVKAGWPKGKKEVAAA